jgi:hypothetical protein
LIGPDNNVYTVVGGVGGHQGQSQNVKKVDLLDGTSGVLRIRQDGQPVADNPLIGARVIIVVRVNMDMEETRGHSRPY